MNLEFRGLRLFVPGERIKTDQRPVGTRGAVE